MSSDHPSDKTTNISLVPSVLGFGLASVVALVVMFGSMLWNHFGGF
ncbi:hypothetical protein [Patulibacter sp. SYSU D01012]|nr:hypothetical protein [Patulibacter sp. SYSU D01012]